MSPAIPARAGPRYTANDGGDIVAVAVGIPDRIQIGAGVLPGYLVSSCRLLRADWRHGAELSRYNRRAALFQRGARPACIKIIIAANLRQTDRSTGLDHRCRKTDDPVAIQVLMEAGLERFQHIAGSRYEAGIGDVVAAVVGCPNLILVGTLTFQATSYPVAVCSAAIGVIVPN